MKGHDAHPWRSLRSMVSVWRDFGKQIVVLHYTLVAGRSDSRTLFAPAASRRCTSEGALLGFLVASPAGEGSPCAQFRSEDPSRRSFAWGRHRRGAASSCALSCEAWGGLFQNDAWLRSRHDVASQIGTRMHFGQKVSNIAMRKCCHATEETSCGRKPSTVLSVTVGNTLGQSTAGGASREALEPAEGVAHGLSRNVEIIKPERDDRSYRYLGLPNGLNAVVVSDPHTEMAASSMFIRVGHMQDPEELAGMAHFHEHMLFLGTEKYPEEGDFERYLTQHGGSSNAYTATESTNYYFDVEASKLQDAIDRFAQFFQTPLFSVSSMERELQAVDSEHSNNKNEDSWRLFQVLKATANQRHAFSKFGSGNYATLRPRLEEGIDTRTSLINFHHKYYSADAMKLCVLGKEDVDTLEDWVRQAFSGVRNTAPPAIPDYGPAPAFGASELGRKVTVIPIREARKLALSWPLPPRNMHKRSKPTVYVSHLLGYEGEGGLHALLHGRGWITSLSAGSMISASDFQLFRLTMSLTEAGERHSDEIIELCHRYLALLREDLPQKRIQDNLATMSAIRFRFLEKTSPTGAVQSIATSLGEDEANPTEVLSGAYTIPEWNPAAITDVLQRLNPRNCQILVVSKQDEDDFKKLDEAGNLGSWQKERWYGTPYKVELLPEELLQRLESFPAHEDGAPQFKLPDSNEFIPTDFALRADEEARHEEQGEDVTSDEDRFLHLLPKSIPKTALDTVPREDWSRLVPPSLVATSDVEAGGTRKEDEVAELPVVQVWHKMDRSYRVPRSVIVAKLWTPEPYGSPEAAVHARLFVRLLQDDLRTWVYDAAMADLRYSLKMTTHGLQLSVVGFSSKVALLLSKILGHIGELLSEYRELGEFLESGLKDEDERRELTERQHLLRQRFETQRENFLRGYRNFDKEQPHETAAYYVRQIMEAEVWHVREYMAALEDDSCTPAAMTRYFDRLLTRLHVDVLAHGNVGKDEAASLAPAISSALSNPQLLPEEELPSRHALRLPLGGFDGGDGVVLDLEAATQEEKNSAVQVVFQVGRGKADLELGAAFEFINVVGYTSAFQQLRTQEQLGYMVYTQLERGPAGLVLPPLATDDGEAESSESEEDGDGSEEGAGRRGANHPGGPLSWSIVVQSPDKTPVELEERVEAWVAGFREELQAMPDEEFQATVASMTSSILRRERSMMEEAQIFFANLASRTHDFYRRYRKADAYQRLTKESVLAAYDASLAPGAPGRRKLSVRVASKKYGQEQKAVPEAEGSCEEVTNFGRDEIEDKVKGDRRELGVVLRSLEDIRAFKAETPIYK